MLRKDLVTEFQQLSKCVGPLMVPQESDQGHEPSAQREAREALALSTLTKMQQALDQLDGAPVHHTKKPFAGGPPRSIKEVAAPPFPADEAPLKVKGIKEVPAEDVQAAEDELIVTHLVRFLNDCFSAATAEHLDGLVVLSHCSDTDWDDDVQVPNGLDLVVQSVEKPTMPPRSGGVPKASGSPRSFRITIKPDLDSNSESDWT